MQYKIINQLKKASKKTNIDFTDKDFLKYIENAKTINLYSNELSEYIQKFINIDSLKNNIEIDFETIGKMFFTLILYKTNPNNYNDKENRKLTKLDKDQMELSQDLINIYNDTMAMLYQKHLNGKKGGAPKNNQKQPKTTKNNQKQAYKYKYK